MLSCAAQVRVVGVHLVDVEAKPYLALVQETAPGGDLGWQIEDCDFHTGRRGAASMVSRPTQTSDRILSTVTHSSAFSSVVWLQMAT